MPNYTVTWVIDADEAATPREAAQQVADAYFAPHIAGGGEDTACCFTVTNEATGEVVQVDLSQDE